MYIVLPIKLLTLNKQSIGVVDIWDKKFILCFKSNLSYSLSDS